MPLSIDYTYNAGDRTLTVHADEVVSLQDRKMKVTKGIRHTIFIAADDLQYGMARMLAAIISNDGSAWAVRGRKELVAC